MQLNTRMHVPARHELLEYASEVILAVPAHKEHIRQMEDTLGKTDAQQQEATHEQDEGLRVLKIREALRAKVEVLPLEEAPRSTWELCLWGTAAPAFAPRPPRWRRPACSSCPYVHELPLQVHDVDVG